MSRSPLLFRGLYIVQCCTGPTTEMQIPTFRWDLTRPSTLRTWDATAMRAVEFRSRNRSSQVDLGHIRQIMSFDHAGAEADWVPDWHNPHHQPYVTTRLTLSYSSDAVSWAAFSLREGGEPHMFVHSEATHPDRWSAFSYGKAVTTHTLPVPIFARHVRFHAVGYSIAHGLRIEMYGPSCKYANGVGSAGLVNRALARSSFSLSHSNPWGNKYSPLYGFTNANVGQNLQANPFPATWLEIDFGRVFSFAGVWSSCPSRVCVVLMAAAR